MRELLVDNRQMVDQQGETRRFDYYIMVGEMGMEGGFACEDYGVRIAPRDGGEGAAIPHITTSISRIDELMTLLIENDVTPGSLADVVADWL